MAWICIWAGAIAVSCFSCVTNYEPLIALQCIWWWWLSLILYLFFFYFSILSRTYINIDGHQCVCVSRLFCIYARNVLSFFFVVSKLMLESRFFFLANLYLHIQRRGNSRIIYALIAILFVRHASHCYFLMRIFSVNGQLFAAFSTSQIPYPRKQKSSGMIRL